MPDPCCGSGKGKCCNTCSVNTSVIISEHMQLVHCLCYVGIRVRGQQYSRVGKQPVRANGEDRELVVAVTLELLLLCIY